MDLKISHQHVLPFSHVRYPIEVSSIPNILRLMSHPRCRSREILRRPGHGEAVLIVNLWGTGLNLCFALMWFLVR